ncbi:hypothetical protein [Bdellovibrio sp. HCB337]|uniref:hypothetical protein n=1 Tax=Bdellovibrio sp. HCB337 TaxID=3394358 RepID=UPI0039A76C63
MFKAILASLILVSSTLSVATTKEMKSAFELQMELSIDGKKVASPSLIALEGEKASISQRNENSKDGSFIEVVTTQEKSETNSNMITLSFVVGTIDRDGKRTILASPRVITIENEKATVSIDQEDQDEVSLSVVARRR